VDVAHGNNMSAKVEDLRNLLSKIQYLIESSHENVPLYAWFYCSGKHSLKTHQDIADYYQVKISKLKSQLAAEREWKNKILTEVHTAYENLFLGKY
jgi:uncharacterized protein YcaQ